MGVDIDVDVDVQFQETVDGKRLASPLPSSRLPSSFIPKPSNIPPFSTSSYHHRHLFSPQSIPVLLSHASQVCLRPQESRLS